MHERFMPALNAELVRGGDERQAGEFGDPGRRGFGETRR
jgi:hypothetical protein